MRPRQAGAHGKGSEGERLTRITFAFKQDAPGFVSWAIRFVTKSEDRLSHVEVIFPDGRSFSSREPKGATWKVIDYSLEKWIYCSVEVTDEELAAATEVANGMDGLGYDFLGIVRLYLVLSRNNKRPFCSEVASLIARAVGLAKKIDPNLTSPQRLYDVLTENPRVIVEASQ